MGKTVLDPSMLMDLPSPALVPHATANPAMNRRAATQTARRPRSRILALLSFIVAILD
jgi:hypothetical protein